MSNGLYNGLDNGLHNGVYNGLENGSKVGMFNNETKNFDADALLYLNNAKINYDIERFATNKLVIGLKKALLWNKLKAFYPFLGRTESSCSYNLKSPYNTNAAYRITFQNSVAQIYYTRFGVELAGVFSVGDTYLIPSTTLTKGDLSMGIYINGGTLTGSAYPATMGSAVSANTDGLQFAIRTTGKYFIPNGQAQNFISVSESSTTGIFIGSVKNGIISLYRNGKEIANNTASSGGSLSVNSVTIGAINGFVTQTYSNIRTGALFIASGLTKEDAIKMDFLIQQFNQLLAR